MQDRRAELTPHGLSFDRQRRANPPNSRTQPNPRGPRPPRAQVGIMAPFAPTPVAPPSPPARHTHLLTFSHSHLPTSAGPRVSKREGATLSILIPFPVRPRRPGLTGRTPRPSADVRRVCPCHLVTFSLCHFAGAAGRPPFRGSLAPIIVPSGWIWMAWTMPVFRLVAILWP